MEGRHCFEHLTIEENLLTGAYTRRAGRAAIQADPELLYAYFPRLKERRGSTAGDTSGGEQQMCPIGPPPATRSTLILPVEHANAPDHQMAETLIGKRERLKKG